ATAAVSRSRRPPATAAGSNWTSAPADRSCANTTMTDALSRRAVLAGAGGAAMAGCGPPVLAARRGEAGGFDLAPSAASSGARVRVWWYAPQRAWTGSPVLMVMHGQGRDGRDYRDAWRAEADRANAIIVAPELTE